MSVEPHRVIDREVPIDPAQCCGLREPFLGGVTAALERRVISFGSRNVLPSIRDRRFATLELFGRPRSTPGPFRLPLRGSVLNASSVVLDLNRETPASRRTSISSPFRSAVSATPRAVSTPSLSRKTSICSADTQPTSCNASSDRAVTSSGSGGAGPAGSGKRHRPRRDDGAGTTRGGSRRPTRPPPPAAGIKREFGKLELPIVVLGTYPDALLHRMPVRRAH